MALGQASPAQFVSLKRRHRLTGHQIKNQRLAKKGSKAGKKRLKGRQEKVQGQARTGTRARTGTIGKQGQLS